MIVNIILSVLVILLILWYFFPLYQVIGSSMYPTYKEGEIICGTKLYFKNNLKVGDIVVYKSPDEDKIVIKRIDKIMKDGGFYCLGDNRDYSYDSRDYGAVSRKRLLSKVLKSRDRRNN